MRRSAEEKLRIYGPPEYREWAESQACTVVGCQTLPSDWRPKDRGLRELCHAKNGGTGRKGDWIWTWVGCWRHHDESHMGVKTFEHRHRGRLEVCGEPVRTMIEAAEATHAAFMDSDLGRAWEARIGEDRNERERR
jgi:hypothetical protein